MRENSRSSFADTVAPRLALMPAPKRLPKSPSSRWALETRGTEQGSGVDARGSSTANGTVVQQYTCNNTWAQHWQFQDAGGGYRRVNNRNAVPQVWDVSGGPGATIGLGLALQVALWWLDHYTGFRDHLDRHGRVILRDDRTAVIYALARPRGLR